MVLTVTLNAAIDRTYRIDGFALDVVHRPSDCRVVAGGKGINVARTIQRLGGLAAATGILAGHNGRFIASSLKSEGIPGRFVWVRGESRTCIAAVDPSRRTQTEINETGPAVSGGAMRRLHRLVRQYIGDISPSWVTLSGSVPPGVPVDVYARLAEASHSMCAKVALDASGEALRRGVVSRPWLLKPNLAELEHVSGTRASSPRHAADIAAGLLGGGTEVVLVTMGAGGCVCVTERERFHVPAPEVPFISAVGSGDALLGALLWALEDGADLREAVVLGVGAGAANACEYGAGFVAEEAVRRMAAATSPVAV